MLDQKCTWHGELYAQTVGGGGRWENVGREKMRTGIQLAAWACVYKQLKCRAVS